MGGVIDIHIILKAMKIDEIAKWHSVREKRNCLRTKPYLFFLQVQEGEEEREGIKVLGYFSS